MNHACLVASSGKPRQAGRVREDRPLGPALPQYHDDGERIGLSARQVPQRSVRSGEALLRLGHQQQRDRQPTPGRHILLRENVRATADRGDFWYARNALPLRLEVRFRRPRGEHPGPGVLPGSRD